jgi:hypothetical protein
MRVSSFRKRASGSGSAGAISTDGDWFIDVNVTYGASGASQQQSWQKWRTAIRSNMAQMNTTNGTQYMSNRHRIHYTLAVTTMTM